jgi:haloacid dehalogenase superfamily, subfamily IA, variant 3 with third motif having DD or ED/haloacid dehalogenase superfamily, subfamily IA, variant 1 with third motif having Dx(3-4)D or Dx(3-4)E/REG-2-like, HAD superfamily (subfamily IA) hydrolase
MGRCFDENMIVSRTGKRVRAVTFDVGGTLIHPWPSVGHLYAEVAAKHGFSGLDQEALNQRFKNAWKSCPDFDYTREGWERLVIQTFAGLIDGPVAFFPELYDRFEQPDAWRVFDDVVPTLESLAAAGIPLAIVSNWDERLRPLLKQLGLAGYFETLAISCEVGFPKPSPVIFQHVAEKLGVPPDEILHIGDSEEMDFRGAISAGLSAELVRRDAKVGNSLRELVRIADPD